MQMTRFVTVLPNTSCPTLLPWCLVSRLYLARPWIGPFFPLICIYLFLLDVRFRVVCFAWLLNTSPRLIGKRFLLTRLLLQMLLNVHKDLKDRAVSYGEPRTATSTFTQLLTACLTRLFYFFQGALRPHVKPCGFHKAN